jgi:shikimate kinase
MRIFLIGYMGSGKSTVGKKLAAKLGLTFIDLDAEIEKVSGQEISALFEKEGEERFRAVEHDTLKRILLTDHFLLATGGGTPCFHHNMELMNSNGLTVYLKMSADSLAQRLENAKKERPLVKGMSGAELREFINTSLEDREDFYQQAHFTVKGKNLDVDELAEFLKKETGVPEQR